MTLIMTLSTSPNKKALLQSSLAQKSRKAFNNLKTSRNYWSLRLKKGPIRRGQKK